jgi:hypothetical protein
MRCRRHCNIPAPQAQTNRKNKKKINKWIDIYVMSLYCSRFITIIWPTLPLPNFSSNHQIEHLRHAAAPFSSSCQLFPALTIHHRWHNHDMIRVAQQHLSWPDHACHRDSVAQPLSKSQVAYPSPSCHVSSFHVSSPSPHTPSPPLPST